eukprot:jgi/Tetstr1/424163/TSEL_014769.t1
MAGVTTRHHACLWCLFQGIHLEGDVRFFGHFAAAAKTQWQHSFAHVLPPGNGVRDTRARQEGKAHKRCITEVLQDPGRQYVHSCFAGADGSLVTDTEQEALQCASAADKLPKGLTATGHTHVKEFGLDGLKVHDIKEDTTNIKRIEVSKPDHESYTM